MDRDPGDFEPKDADPSRDVENDRVDALLASLPPCPGLPSTSEEIAASDARAEADIAAGRVYPHAIVGQWLKTWGKPDQKPFKEWLAEVHG